MRIPLFAILLLLMVSAAYPTQLTIYEPVATVVSDGDEIHLGVVGPGQTAHIIAESKIKEGGIQGKGGILDQLVFVSTPTDWEGVPSDLYGSPMKAIIKVASDAEDGEYELLIRAVDEAPGEGLGDVSFRAKVNVSKDILKVDVWPERVVTGAGQPAGYYVKISNDGVASDVFEISSEGMPLWDYSKVVYVPRESSRVVKYEIVGDVEQEYTVKLKVRALSSDRLTAQRDVIVDVNTNLVSDLQATGNGLLLFPAIEQPVYSLMGLLSNIIFG